MTSSAPRPRPPPYPRKGLPVDSEGGAVNSENDGRGLYRRGGNDQVWEELPDTRRAFLRSCHQRTLKFTDSGGRCPLHRRHESGGVYRRQQYRRADRGCVGGYRLACAKSRNRIFRRRGGAPPPPPNSCPRGLTKIP